MDWREIVKVGFAIIWTLQCARMIHIVDRNEKNEVAIRNKTRREATNASTEAWLALYEDEKRRHHEDVADLQQKIIDLQERIEQYENEISRWKLIGNKLWDSSKRGKDD